MERTLDFLKKNNLIFIESNCEFCSHISTDKKILLDIEYGIYKLSKIIIGLYQNQIPATLVFFSNSKEIRMYQLPTAKEIQQFVDENKDLINKVDYRKYNQQLNEKALSFLNLITINLFDSDINLVNPTKGIAINKTNLYYYNELFEKYALNPIRLITFLAKLNKNNSNLIIDSKGIIFDSKKMKPFTNQDIHTSKLNQSTLNGNKNKRIDYLPILNQFDKEFLEKSYIDSDNLKELLHFFDSLTPTKIRREYGKYFTDTDISIIAAERIRSFLNPQHIIEPYVGSGSLLEPFINDNIVITANDISKSQITVLRKKYNKSNMIIHNQDFISTTISDIKQNWGIDESKVLLFYTNPPFGTVSANLLTQKKSETTKKSRVITINYGSLEKRYGKGDLVIPAVGKMIDIIKALGHGYLVFFSPLGVFCGRNRYLKVLKALLYDFEYLYGEIFPGNKFHDVNKNKPISFTIWRYNKDVNTPFRNLKFKHEGAYFKVKKSRLLRDYWRYDTRKYIRGEIVAQGNDRFNAAAPKMMHLQIKKGGSELIQENVIKSLNILNLPDPLIFGLWSCTVGYRSITKHPIYVDNALVHLPQFDKNETQKILAYTALFLIITERSTNYTKGKIGFSKDGDIIFGGEKLTKGTRYLLKKYGKLLISTLTIEEVLERLKKNELHEKAIKEIRKAIKENIEKLLIKIGYWEYIPAPKEIFGRKNNSKTLKQWLG